MSVDLSKVYLHWSGRTYKGKKYRSYSLARSYRVDGKVRKEIVQRLGSLTDDQVLQWRQILRDIKTLKSPLVDAPNSQDSYNDVPAAIDTGGDTVAKKKIEYSDADQNRDCPFFCVNGFNHVSKPNLSP